MKSLAIALSSDASITQDLLGTQAKKTNKQKLLKYHKHLALIQKGQCVIYHESSSLINAQKHYILNTTYIQHFLLFSYFSF